MGLTTWKGAQVRKADVVISKNYLSEAEMTELNRLTTMFLDFAEDRAERRQQTLMADWVAQADRFLEFNERAILDDAGHVSAADVERTVGERYAEFDKRRRALEGDEAAETEAHDLHELIDIERRNRGTMKDGQ